ncbi:MAG: AAA family ATPase, partial [Proteobacteria bacterium]|nr:AAA family ATPase [Pseudomonadota bacterium]
MYQSYFNLDREPFSIAPDPNFLYLSDGHSEALAHLTYGFSHGGFVLITGEVGTGKTTLLRNLIKRTPADLDVAFILNPRLTVRELLETICEELGVLTQPEPSMTVKGYIDRLNQHLLRTHQHGRSTVVIIDEAQNLSPAVLEQIRLLTNLETDERKLLRIILLGQPELADMLARPALRQLAQRITARYHLRHLNREECFEYVAHRLSRAGGDPNLFERAAVARLYRLSKGIPRLINILADRALLGAYATSSQRVTADLVNRAATEILPGRAPHKRWVSVGIVCVTAMVMIWAWMTLSPVPLLATGEPVQTTTPASPVVAGTSGAAETFDPSSASEPDNTKSPPAATDNEAAESPVLPLVIEQNTSQNDLSSLPPADLTRPPGSTYLLLRRAFANLFELWNVEYDPEVSTIPCDVAPSVDLQCLSQRGSWSDMLAHNLPVILELWDQETSPYYALLSRSNETGLTLTIGSRTMIASRNDLRDAWVGRYIGLWRMPPNYQGSLAQG